MLIPPPSHGAAATPKGQNAFLVSTNSETGKPPKGETFGLIFDNNGEQRTDTRGLPATSPAAESETDSPENAESTRQDDPENTDAAAQDIADDDFDPGEGSIDIAVGGPEESDLLLPEPGGGLPGAASGPANVDGPGASTLAENSGSAAASVPHQGGDPDTFPSQSERGQHGAHGGVGGATGPQQPFGEQPKGVAASASGNAAQTAALLAQSPGHPSGLVPAQRADVNSPTAFAQPGDAPMATTTTSDRFGLAVTALAEGRMSASPKATGPSAASPAGKSLSRSEPIAANGVSEIPGLAVSRTGAASDISKLPASSPAQSVVNATQVAAGMPNATPHPAATRETREAPRLSETRTAASSDQSLRATPSLGQPAFNTVQSMVIGPGSITDPAAVQEMSDTLRLSAGADTSLPETRIFAPDAQPATRALQAVFQQPEMPRHVAQQLASALGRGGADRPVDLVLNPAELGRVRLSLSTTDSGVSVSILADRPETLDLIRRNIDLLAQDFHDIGYDAAEFSFGQDSAGSAQQQAALTDLPGASAEPETNTSTPPDSRTIMLGDRVDIRL